MNRRSVALVWIVIGLCTLGVVRLALPHNTAFVLGVFAGVAVGGVRTAHHRLSNVTLSTAVGTFSVGVIVATLSVTLISAWWLPLIWTSTLGYAIGIVSTWLLVSGLSLDELGPFAAIGGLLIAVGGGAAGLLFLGDRQLFVVMLFAGLAAGVLVPLSGLVFSLVQTAPRPRRSTDEDTIEPATRFGIEAATIAGLAVAVPFGSRAAALFGTGVPSAFPVGLGCGTLLSVGLWTVGTGQSKQLDRLRARFVERAYRLLGRIERWIEQRRREGAERAVEDESLGGEGEHETAAAADDSASIANASRLVEGAAGSLADHEQVIEAASRVDTLVETSALRARVGVFWGRFSGAISREALSAGMALQLSAAEDAHQRGDSKQAQSLTDTALELAAPTIGSVAAAVLRGRRHGRASVLDSLAPLLARIEQLLGDEQLPMDPDDPDGLQLVQQLLERLVDEEAGEGFDTALSRIRAAAADGWYSVQAGDQALSEARYQRALVAYLAAIEAYRRAYDIAEEATKTATTKRATPDESTADHGSKVTASADTYASEASRIGTAIEALCHDTAAVVIAAIDDLYGTEPPPTVDTEARRTIVRSLRELRRTRRRIDASVPPVDLADDRYQRAEIARSIARLRRHLATADETAMAGNIEAAVEQYERTADRLDVLSNRAGTAGLTDLARTLTKTAAAIGGLAAEPTAKGVANRPEPAVPSTDDHRAPSVVPAGRRLRRTFCQPAFVELRAFVADAGDHAMLDQAGEPYPQLVGSVGLALASLDPLYTEPAVDSLLQWVSEVSLAAMAAAVETVSEQHNRLVEADPSPPPTFQEPPAVLRDGAAASVPTAEGVAAFNEAWLSRATALADATETIERQQSAVDGFAALEPRVRQTLQRDGKIDSSQVDAELLVVAAHHLTGVEYDSEKGVLSKTGPIGRASHEQIKTDNRGSSA